jgi:UDP-glucose:(heptosyl)LPS alpha-1,3-glucosyltransferase
MAMSLGVGGNVHFLGTREDVPLFLAGADFLLQPSLNENTGNAIVEALVAGVPVLATENCGYAEHIILANAGRVIPNTPFTQGSMNMMLEEILLSSERETWKKNALAYADKTDLYNRFMIIGDVIETIAADKKPRI